jgi:hypothetical protein
MKNIQLSSPERDRKVSRLLSIVFMSVAWLFLAGLRTWILATSRLPDKKFHWTKFDFIVISVFLVPLVLIPIQLVRYFRGK